MINLIDNPWVLPPIPPDYDHASRRLCRLGYFVIVWAPDKEFVKTVKFLAHHWHPDKE
ncbi:MAG: hypothetical protein FWD06_07295 [Oscillospiraceae bacterium]|nr:hypothetical protein [Oscillospiraceae bacterium]